MKCVYSTDFVFFPKGIIFFCHYSLSDTVITSIYIMFTLHEVLQMIITNGTTPEEINFQNKKINHQNTHKYIKIFWTYSKKNVNHGKEQLWKTFGLVASMCTLHEHMIQVQLLAKAPLASVMMKNWAAIKIVVAPPGCKFWS